MERSMDVSMKGQSAENLPADRGGVNPSHGRASRVGVRVLVEGSVRNLSRGPRILEVGDDALRP